MKKSILIACLALFFTQNSYGQTDSLAKKHKHEVGADLTMLIKQVFNLNQGNGYSPVYIPTYYFSYRYHLNKSNIRFGIGGAYTSRSAGTYSVNGVETNPVNTSGNLSFRVGYERVSELSNKWQAFYGFDFRPAFTNTNEQANYSNGGYLNGTVASSQVYGFAPLLGFRFRFNKRVSLLTETSFSFNIEKTSTQKTYVSQDQKLFPPIPYGKKIKATNLISGFSPPLFLILTVDI